MLYNIKLIVVAVVTFIVARDDDRIIGGCPNEDCSCRVRISN